MDMQVALSHMTNQIDIQTSKNAKMSKIVAQQSRKIKKLEVDYSMLYELVLGLTRSLHSLVTHPKVLIGYVLLQ